MIYANAHLIIIITFYRIVLDSMNLNFADRIVVSTSTLHIYYHSFTICELGNGNISSGLISAARGSPPKNWFDYLRHLRGLWLVAKASYTLWVEEFERKQKRALLTRIEFS